MNKVHATEDPLNLNKAGLHAVEGYTEHPAVHDIEAPLRPSCH